LASIALFYFRLNLNKKNILYLLKLAYHLFIILINWILMMSKEILEKELNESYLTVERTRFSSHYQ